MGLFNKLKQKENDDELAVKVFSILTTKNLIPGEAATYSVLTDSEILEECEARYKEDWNLNKVNRAIKRLEKVHVISLIKPNKQDRAILIDYSILETLLEVLGKNKKETSK